MDRDSKKRPAKLGRAKLKKHVPGPDDAHTVFMAPEPTATNGVEPLPFLDCGLIVRVGNRWIEAQAGRYEERIRLEIQGSDSTRLLALLIFVARNGVIPASLMPPKSREAPLRSTGRKGVER